MFIASMHSRAHIVHDQHCPYARRIAKTNEICWHFQEDALKEGYCLCTHCSTVSRAYKKEQHKLDDYARLHQMTLTWKDHLLKIHTPHSDWIVAPHEKTPISLFHKNVFQPFYQARRPTFPGYHSQRVLRRTLLGYLKYIAHHDGYRQGHPVKTPLDSTLPQLKHGVHYSKGKRKAVKQLRRKQNIRRVRFLLSNL